MAKKKKAAAKKPVQKKAAPKAKSAKKAKPAIKAKPAAKAAKPAAKAAGKKAPAKPMKAKAAAKPAAKPSKPAAKPSKPAAKPVSKLKQAVKAVAKVAGKAASVVKAIARKPPVRKPAAPVHTPVDDGWEAAQSFARPGSNGEHDIALNIVEAMALTALADGSVEATEQVMIARLAAQPALASIQDLASPIRRALDRFRQVGAQQAMLEAVAPISDPLDRERAFLACVAVATADGTVKASEIEVLEVLKQAFDYSSEDVMRLVGA